MQKWTIYYLYLDGIISLIVWFFTVYESGKMLTTCLGIKTIQKARLGNSLEESPQWWCSPGVALYKASIRPVTYKYDIENIIIQCVLSVKCVLYNRYVIFCEFIWARNRNIKWYLQNSINQWLNERKNRWISKTLAKIDEFFEIPVF